MIAGFVRLQMNTIMRKAAAWVARTTTAACMLVPLPMSTAKALAQPMYSLTALGTLAVC